MSMKPRIRATGKRRENAPRRRATCSNRHTRRFLAALLLAIAPGAARAETTPLPTSLRVGVSGDYAPFSVLPDASPERGALAPAGFDAELARLFARDAGFEIEWVRFRWPELAADLAADRFDVAMSGVTWTVERATQGWLTRATVATGPCWLGAETPARVGVNRGGALERFARRRFAGATITAVDANRSLPDLLQGGSVDAIVTDRFEIRSFRRGDWAEHCEPASERKVLWVSPPRAKDLGPRLDDWLARNEKAVDALRVRWLGGSAPRSDADHLIDLAARRLALMPAVARAKGARGQALVDPAREKQVLDAVRAQAKARRLDVDSVEALFRLQIELGTRVQQRATGAIAAAPSLDLGESLRPAISAIGDRIVDALAKSAPIAAESLRAADAAPLATWLEAEEQESLRAALAAVRRNGGR
jgi:cyclohexadienyl dehydratase